MEKKKNKIIQSLQEVNFEGILEEKPINFSVEYTEIDDPGDSYNSWSIANGILDVKIFDINVDDGIETLIGTIVKLSMKNVKVALSWLFFELSTILILLSSFLSPIILIIAVIAVALFSVFELRYKKSRKELYREKLVNTNFYKKKSKIEKNVNLFIGNIYKTFYYKLILKLLILTLWIVMYIGTVFFDLV